MIEETNKELEKNEMKLLGKKKKSNNSLTTISKDYIDGQIWCSRCKGYHDANLHNRIMKINDSQHNINKNLDFSEKINNNKYFCDNNNNENQAKIDKLKNRINQIQEIRNKNINTYTKQRYNGEKYENVEIKKLNYENKFKNKEENEKKYLNFNPSVNNMRNISENVSFVEKIKQNGDKVRIAPLSEITSGGMTPDLGIPPSDIKQISVLPQSARSLASCLTTHASPGPLVSQS